MLPQILPVEDAEISAFARKEFEKQGIKIVTGAKVTKLDKKSDGVTATVDAGGKTRTDHGRPRHLRCRLVGNIAGASSVSPNRPRRRKSSISASAVSPSSATAKPLRWAKTKAWRR